MTPRRPRRAPAALTVVLALSACTPEPPPTVASPVQQTMFTHFSLASDLRTFAINADLSRIRVTAAELATEEPTWGMPPGSGSLQDRVHRAAQAVADAAEGGDAPGAALAIAQVAAACGECHLANDATLGQRFQVAAPLLTDAATRHTNYLSWVSRLLWDGLVGPSENLWRTGAGALAGPDGLPAPRGTFVPASEVARAGERLRTLGEDAVLAEDPGARARILGEVWQTCADCHTQAGVR